MPHRAQAAAIPAGNARYEFGENWNRFVRNSFSPEKIEIAQRHILEFLGRNDLAGLTILDIGCGSGLHALAMMKAGAAAVHAFDYDPMSVAASRYIHGEASHPPGWTIAQASVLDDAYMESLPQFDLVYSWGVLHHTGDVWHGLRNAAQRVKPGGLLYIALYSADAQIDPGPEFWLSVKRRYVTGGWITRRSMELWYIWRFEMGKRLHRLPLFLNRVRDYKKNRGMSKLTDIRDWLGGWPMEFVHDKEAVSYVESRGFTLKKIKTGEANTEFLFVREAP